MFRETTANRASLQRSGGGAGAMVKGIDPRLMQTVPLSKQDTKGNSFLRLCNLLSWATILAGRRGHLALLWDPDGSVDHSGGTGGGVAAEILCLPGVLGTQGILHLFRGDVALGLRARRNFAGLVEKDRGFHPHRCGSAVRDVGRALLPPAAEPPAGKNQAKKDDETGALVSKHAEGTDREALGRHGIEAGALVKPDASTRGRPAFLAPPETIRTAS